MGVARAFRAAINPAPVSCRIIQIFAVRHLDAARLGQRIRVGGVKIRAAGPEHVPASHARGARPRAQGRPSAPPPFNGMLKRVTAAAVIALQIKRRPLVAAVHRDLRRAGDNLPILQRRRRARQRTNFKRVRRRRPAPVAAQILYYGVMTLHFPLLRVVIQRIPRFYRRALQLANLRADSDHRNDGKRANIANIKEPLGRNKADL